jgi:hypothetical protein
VPLISVPLISVPLILVPGPRLVSSPLRMPRTCRPLARYRVTRSSPIARRQRNPERAHARSLVGWRSALPHSPLVTIGRCRLGRPPGTPRRRRVERRVVLDRAAKRRHVAVQAAEVGTAAVRASTGRAVRTAAVRTADLCTADLCTADLCTADVRPADVRTVEACPSGVRAGGRTRANCLPRTPDDQVVHLHHAGHDGGKCRHRPPRHQLGERQQYPQRDHALEQHEAREAADPYVLQS